jgi:hypothetical protein
LCFHPKTLKSIHAAVPIIKGDKLLDVKTKQEYGKNTFVRGQSYKKTFIGVHLDKIIRVNSILIL